MYRGEIVTRRPCLLVLLLLPAAALAQESGALRSSEQVEAQAQQEKDVPAAPPREGPDLDLEGLEDPAAGAAKQPSGQKVEESFTDRLQPTHTLSERAASILDRTT